MNALRGFTSRYLPRAAVSQSHTRMLELRASLSRSLTYRKDIDGLRGMQLVEKVLESSAKQAWVDVPAFTSESAAR